MTFRKIYAAMTNNQSHTLKKPSLFRACVNGDKAEYIDVEKKLMAEYRKVNNIGDDDGLQVWSRASNKRRKA